MISVSIGVTVGASVGAIVGAAVGKLVGASVGAAVGKFVGIADGTAVGRLVGGSVGAAVDTLIGASVGEAGVTTVGLGATPVALGELAVRTSFVGSATLDRDGAKVGVKVGSGSLPRQALNPNTANAANAKPRTSTIACVRPTRMRLGGPERTVIVGVATSDRPPSTSCKSTAIARAVG